ERREVSALSVLGRHASFTHESTSRPSAAKRVSPTRPTASMMPSSLEKRPTMSTAGTRCVIFAASPLWTATYFIMLFGQMLAVTLIVRTDDATAELHASMIDIQPTVNTNYADSDTRAIDIARLLAAGVETSSNRPLKTLDNCLPHALVKRTTTSRIARWKKFSWPTIVSMDVLAVFRMCMPEEFMRVHMIPSMNQHLDAMINNHLTESGGIQHSLIRAKKRSRVFIEIEHKHMIKPNKTGCWDPTKKIFTPVKMAYLKEKCRTCDATIGTYCSCDKGTPMCKVCYGKHLVAVENIN
ncbi:LOW QUALITY PROTEIN: hypothetical protein HJC23_005519, partial [Cyclotella cryptica]